MKILWVSHSGTLLGGGEQVLNEAIRGLSARGVENLLIAPKRDQLADSMSQIGVDLHAVPFTTWVSMGPWRAARYRFKRTARNLAYLPAVFRIIRRTRPDVVVTNTLATPVGAVAARLAGVPHVWYMHEMPGADGHGWEFDIGNRLSLWLIDKLSARVAINSQATLQSFSQHVSRQKLHMVAYGIEVPQHLEPRGRREGLWLIQVGELSPGKRPEDAIRATALLTARGIDVHLTLLGNEQPLHGAFLRQLVEELDLGSRIRFVPFDPDPFRHMAAADIVVMCSRGEAFGRVTAEALKMGMVVVGADSGGTPELIQDGTTGLLFRPGDPEDLARKLESLAGDRDRMARLGENARAWGTERFTTDRFLDALVELFEEVSRG